MQIILDLDETLIHTSMDWLGRCPDFSFRLYSEIYHIYLRPGLFAFLKFLIRNFEVHIWTAADKTYARCILKRILGVYWYRKIHSFRHREHCKTWCRQHVKDLRLISSECLLIDDNPIHGYYKRKFYKNDISRNILACKPFEGNKHDTELSRLSRMLKYNCLNI